MSSSVVDLEAQVESVLGALVKAATVELTKLFESRYRASTMDVGRADDNKHNKTQDTLSNGDTTRSIGVQVDEDICPLFELTGAYVCSFKCFHFLFTSMARLQDYIIHPWVICTRRMHAISLRCKVQLVRLYSVQLKKHVMFLFNCCPKSCMVFPIANPKCKGMYGS